jgi:signal transduction histidine kinase
MENGSLFLNTLKQKIDGKDFYFNLKTSKISEDDVVEYIITLTDITHEKNIEISKDDFITITSHELRTPMTIIKSYIWLINEGKAGSINEKQKEYLTKSLNATERMLNLINDMLSVSKIEQGRVDFKMESVDLDEFIAETLNEFELKAKESGNKLIFEHTNEPKLVIADKKRLKEVMYNLVGNAMKFTQNGKIKIIVTQTNTPVANDDTFVKVSVVDSGKGIPKEDMDKLFKKFGKLEHSYEKMAENGGTGLGLYITRQLIEGMGGKISAKSAGIGLGSEFYFFLQKDLSKKK